MYWTDSRATVQSYMSKIVDPAKQMHGCSASLGNCLQARHIHSLRWLGVVLNNPRHHKKARTKIIDFMRLTTIEPDSQLLV